MIKANESRSIPYLKSFILVLLEILLLEKETFQSASNVGYKLGKILKEIEGNPNRLKKFIYDLKRCRRLEDFLSIVNLMQTRASVSIFSKALFNNSNFEVIKVGFLIGYANAIFESKKIEEKITNE
jgi:hypothetical protein